MSDDSPGVQVSGAAGFDLPDLQDIYAAPDETPSNGQISISFYRRGDEVTASIRTADGGWFLIRMDRAELRRLVE